MEREKMIETILHYMCPFFSDGMCRGEILCNDNCVKRSFAKDAVNELIPDGAVVLTREECDNKVILDEDHFQRVLDNERENARKETAREIYRELMRHGTTYVKKFIIEHYGL